ncbi:MAG: acetylglutamate kinase [Halobacteriota archaeon]|nr:acetylglutamate kinase [Halobacteriota archaeon]
MELTRENVLIEALPYIREFHDSILVIKVGGKALIDLKTMDGIIQDAVLLRYVGAFPILIHGGGSEITHKMELFGKKPEFVSGLRVTDDETLEIAQMVLVGNVNHRLVSMIGKHGGKGVGLSGKDGQLIMAKKKDPQRVLVKGEEQDVDLGWVGEVESINPEILWLVCENGYIPVVSPIAVDDMGNSLNVNADIVAGDIAAALKAKKLIMLTDVLGVLKDPSDPDTLISKIKIDEVDELMKGGTIKGGMIPKMEACVNAVESGVENAHIINGTLKHSTLLELFTNKGIGSMVYR